MFRKIAGTTYIYEIISVLSKQLYRKPTLFKQSETRSSFNWIRKQVLTVKNRFKEELTSFLIFSLYEINLSS